ncbi:hypothetical protein T439DRAFT_134579 [Meredithblackwellia eburnea MCA 4105]
MPPQRIRTSRNSLPKGAACVACEFVSSRSNLWRGLNAADHLPHIHIEGRSRKIRCDGQHPCGRCVRTAKLLGQEVVGCSFVNLQPRPQSKQQQKGVELAETHRLPSDKKIEVLTSSTSWHFSSRGSGCSSSPPLRRRLTIQTSSIVQLRQDAINIGIVSQDINILVGGDSQHLPAPGRIFGSL